MGKSTSLGTLIALGKSARMTFPFLELFTADGRRERGARTELALRARADRAFDGVGDVEREERRDRGEVELVVAAMVVEVVTVSKVTARGGVEANFGMSSREAVGESDLGEDTRVSPSRS
jgi:hypothetical protein